MTQDDPAGQRATPPETAEVWRWRCEGEAGDLLQIDAPGFDSQKAAEGWLAENFEDLADDGVATVTLLNGQRAVYGPMSLAPDA